MRPSELHPHPTLSPQGRGTRNTCARQKGGGLCIFLAILLASCAQPSKEVWVDLDKVVDASHPVAAPVLTVPKPPSGLPAETYTLPSRPAELVTGSSPAAEARTVRRVEASQEQALKHLEQRLQAIYARQADLYAQEQTRLLGDPNQRALEKLMPDFLAAFKEYAAQRTPVYIRLINLAGFPDPNPKGDPPASGLSPLAKKFWLQANEVRAQLNGIDQAYDKKAAGLVAEVGRLADQDRLALLRKVEAFRREMNERAIEEASSPQQSNAAVVLSIPSRPAVVLPPVSARTQTLAAVPPPPPPPKVDSQEARLGPAERRDLIERQLSIWLALNHWVLAGKPGRRVPDETQEFEAWRTQQQVGP